MTYSGRFLVMSNMFPIYKPSIPKVLKIDPPKKKMDATIVLQPSGFASYIKNKMNT